MISTPKNNTPYTLSVQSVSRCFPMTSFKDGSACVFFRSEKVKKGAKRLEKVTEEHSMLFVFLKMDLSSSTPVAARMLVGMLRH